PDTSLLEVFPTPDQAGDAPFVIEHIAEEFTSLCPKTGHPDFGDIVLRYSPKPAGRGGVCVELTALKPYLQSFRTEGIFYEAVTNSIRSDLVHAMNPEWLQIITVWRGRGGIRSVVRAEHGDVPPEYAGTVYSV